MLVIRLVKSWLHFLVSCPQFGQFGHLNTLHCSAFSRVGLEGAQCDKLLSHRHSRSMILHEVIIKWEINQSPL